MSTKDREAEVFAEASAAELKRLRGPDEFEAALIELMHAQKRAGISLVTSQMPAGGNGVMTATARMDGQTVTYGVRITDWKVIVREPDLTKEDEPAQK